MAAIRVLQRSAIWRFFTRLSFIFPTFEAMFFACSHVEQSIFRASGFVVLGLAIARLDQRLPAFRRAVAAAEA